MADTLHAPAWDGFVPRPAERHEVTAELASRLRRALGLRGEVLALQPGSRTAEGFYQFLGGGEQDLFIKVVREQRFRDLAAADRLAAWLAARGQPASAMLGSGPLAPERGLDMLIYRLHRLRPVAPEPGELEGVGHALGGMHRALRDYPGRDDIFAATERRNAFFVDLARHSASYPDAETALPAIDRQVLHGDLNAGNVMIREDRGSPLFMDFEDALHNAHAPCVDVAMCLERLVLVHLGDDAHASKAMQAFLRGYTRGAGAPLAWAVPAGDVLEALAHRALLLLEQAGAEKLGRDVVDAERAKFEGLLKLTRRRTALLDRICGC